MVSGYIQCVYLPRKGTSSCAANASPPPLENTLLHSYWTIHTTCDKYLFKFVMYGNVLPTYMQTCYSRCHCWCCNKSLLV